MDIEHKLDRYEDIVEQIRPILANQNPQVQGAVIADLFAMFLASHQGPDAEMVREALREHWLDMVDGLLPIHDEEVKKFLKKNYKKN